MANLRKLPDMLANKFKNHEVTPLTKLPRLTLLRNQFSNHKSSFQITNQVQNQFVFKSRTLNLLVTDPSTL